MSPRILVLSDDPGSGSRLADELGVDAAVVSALGDADIAILATADLGAFVDAMRASERLLGVTASLDPRWLAALRAYIAGQPVSIEQLAPDVTVRSERVGNYREKSQCITLVGEHAAQAGVRRKYRSAIELCLDEMLMNALYDAPVDETGKQRFVGVERTSIDLPDAQKAIVHYACDGKRFFLSVRDAFGSLARHTVVHYLHKCLHEVQQIDQRTDKAGGAGLGLYMMASSSTQLLFEVRPGVATAVTCVFDLEAKRPALGSFGFFSGVPHAA